MKKIYVSPTVEMEFIRTSQLLTESIDDIGGDGPGYSGGGHGGGGAKDRDDEIEELIESQEETVWGQLW